MPLATTDPVKFEAAPEGGSWFRGWASSRIRAGVTNRRMTAAELLARVPASGAVEAEQVHGASIAAVERSGMPPVAGCDALITSRPGIALQIRTADCLPILFADPRRGVIGIAHAGWRGIAAALPARMIEMFRRAYQAPAEELYAAIGPAIRPCCYEVGPEFEERFGPFIEQRGPRRMCNLIGAATEQLRACGVRAERITDSGACTACRTDEWYSLRTEGQATGRLTSLILMI